MPRPSSLIPTYRKHSSGQARVTVNGRDYLLGPFGTKASQTEYDRIIAEYLESGRSATFGVSCNDVTTAMLMADYRSDLAEAYHSLGILYQELNRYPQSLASYEEGRQIREQLVAMSICNA